MMNLLELVIYSLLLTLAITGCNNDKASEITENMVTDSVFKYKGAYVGDNSAIGGIIDRLNIAEGFNGSQLFTSKEPYGIYI